MGHPRAWPCRGCAGATPESSCVRAVLWLFRLGTPQGLTVVGTTQGLAMLGAPRVLGCVRAFLKPGCTGDAQRPGCVGTRRDTPGPGHAEDVVILGTRPSPQPAGAASPALFSRVPWQRGQAWQPFGVTAGQGWGRCHPHSLTSFSSPVPRQRGRARGAEPSICSGDEGHVCSARRVPRWL